MFVNVLTLTDGRQKMNRKSYTQIRVSKHFSHMRIMRTFLNTYNAHICDDRLKFFIFVETLNTNTYITYT